jgi:colicin import membrane protein
MRPAEFAPDAIIQAGKELQAAGRNITGFALRQRVGGGNPSRLRQVWDEFAASQSVVKIEPAAELPVEVADELAAVSQALTERLMALAVELNDKAVKAAERRVHEVVRSAGEQREQAERELTDASQTVDDLESKLDAAHAEIQALGTQLAAARATAQGQAVELAQLRERLSVTEQAAQTERIRHQHEAELLRAELAEHKSVIQGITNERDQGRTALASTEALTREAEIGTQRLGQAEVDRERARQEASQARETAAQLRGQVEALQAQAAALTQALGGRHTSE